MIFVRKLWLILLLYPFVWSYNTVSSSSSEDEKMVVSSSSPVVESKTENLKKRPHEGESKKIQKTKKLRPSVGTVLKEEQSQIYAIPTYDATFKYLMPDPEICLSFLRSLYP